MRVAIAAIDPLPAVLVEDAGQIVLVLDEATPPPLAAALRRLLCHIDAKAADG